MVAIEGVTINSPHFELLVNFGSVPVGKNVDKWIEVINLSPVTKLPFIYSFSCCIVIHLQQKFCLCFSGIYLFF